MGKRFNQLGRGEEEKWRRPAPLAQIEGKRCLHFLLPRAATFRAHLTCAPHASPAGKKKTTTLRALLYACLLRSWA